MVLHHAEHTTPERLQALEASIHGPHGGMNMVHASARLEALTALEHRQFNDIFGHVLGVLGYCSSFMGRAPFPYCEDIQDEAARIALGFPPRKVQRNLDRVALCGDLGLPKVASRLGRRTGGRHASPIPPHRIPLRPEIIATLARIQHIPPGLRAAG